MVAVLNSVFAFSVLASGSVNAYFPFSVFELLVGLIHLAALWFYYNAILIEEVSRVVILSQISPVFVAFLSIAFLNEVLGIEKYLGIGLLVLRSAFVSYQKSNIKASFCPALPSSCCPTI